MRRFLSERARERHYARNPAHAPRRFDGDGNPPIDGWAELERGDETVIVVPREDGPGDLEAVFDPAARVVHVRDADGDEPLDVSHLRNVESREFEWAFDGHRLELAFRG